MRRESRPRLPLEKHVRSGHPANDDPRLRYGRDGVLKHWCRSHQQPMEDAGFTDHQTVEACKRLLLLVLDNPKFQAKTKGKRDEGTMRYALIQLGAACCLVGDDAMRAVYAAGRKAPPRITTTPAEERVDAAPTE